MQEGPNLQDLGKGPRPRSGTRLFHGLGDEGVLLLAAWEVGP